jgi:hypothetical protein
MALSQIKQCMSEMHIRHCASTLMCLFAKMNRHGKVLCSVLEINILIFDGILSFHSFDHTKLSSHEPTPFVLNGPILT